MPIPDPVLFEQYTAPLTKTIGPFKIGSGYGKNMMKVLAALQAYWKNAAPIR